MTGDWRLLTFGSGHQWRRASRRLASQALATGWFSDVIIESDVTLQRDHGVFDTEFGSWLRQHPRGYGYWLWKPYLVQYHVRRLPNYANLIYLDAGCEFIRSADRATRWAEYNDVVATQGILSMELPGCTEASWCKGDVLSLLRDDQERESFQRVAGMIMLRKRDSTIQLTQDWWDLCREDPRVLSDSPSGTRNDQHFIEHRHDQAVWSVVLKNAKIPAVVDETISMDGISPHQKGPIWAARNRYSRPFLSKRRRDVLRIRTEQVSDRLRRSPTRR